MSDKPAGKSKQDHGGATAHRFSVSFVPGVVFLIDLIVLVASALQSFRYLVILHNGETNSYVFAIAFITVSTLILFQRASLYELDAIMRPLRFSDAILASVLTSLLIFLSIIFSLEVYDRYNLQWVLWFGAAATVFTAGSRMLIYFALRRLSKSRWVGKTLVVYGAGEQARRFIDNLQNVSPYFTHFAGVYHDDASDEADEGANYRVLGGIDNLMADIRSGFVDDVVIAMPWSDDMMLVDTVELLKETPVNVHISSDLIGFRLRFRPALGSLSHLSMFEVERRPIAGWSSLFKRLEDYLFSIIALLLLSPVLLLVAIAVKIDDPKGPVLFKQRRLGFNNQTFDIYKFRSMYVHQETDGVVQQATKGDPRITRVGRFIRATSIDELPQLLNVLNGTMSLVGPRPHALSHNEDFGRQIRGYFARHKVKPGITGWAQVNGLRGETQTLEAMERRIDFDVFYAENWSLLFDLRILATTAIVVFFQKTAY